MAVDVVSLDKAYFCLSTDTKPANPSHSKLYETDTGSWYAWTGSAWTPYYSPPEAVLTAPGSAVLTGTFLTTPTESEVVTGGQTIIITLTGRAWAPAGTAFDAQRQAIINGLDSGAAEAGGWDATVKAVMAVTTVVRTSDTVVTITLPATAGYSTTVTETVTVTVPASAIYLGAAAITATPTIPIVSGS